MLGTNLKNDGFDFRGLGAALLWAALVAALTALGLALLPTLTKAAEAQPFAAVSARYVEDLGIGIGGGYQWKSGVMLLGQITYDERNHQHGTVQYGCVQVPWTSPAEGHRGAEIIVAVPLGRKKK